MAKRAAPVATVAPPSRTLAPGTNPDKLGPLDDPYADRRMRKEQPIIRGKNIDDAVQGSRETLLALAEKPPKYYLADVDLDRMIWDKYCRAPGKVNLNRLRANWQPDAVGVIYVSERADGTLAGIEGRHRYTVALEHHMTRLPARVYQDLTYQEEAALYNLFNIRYAHTALDRLKGRLESAEDKALTMTAIIREIGVNWDFDRAGGSSLIKPVATIEQVLDTWGPQVLRDTMQLLHDAWGSKAENYRDDTVAGVAQFLARYGGYPFSLSKYNRTRMLTMMRERGLRQFRSEAVQISLAEHLRRSHSFGRAMRAIYNLYLRNGQLPAWPDRFYSEAGRRVLAASRGRPIPVPQSEPETVSVS